MTTAALSSIASAIPRRLSAIDARERRAMEEELAQVADALLDAERARLPLWKAVADARRWPALAALHTGLRDALLLEVPADLLPWARTVSLGGSAPPLDGMARLLGTETDAPPRERALARFFVFEAVRLRLLVATWADDAFEAVGGTEADADRLAFAAVSAFEGEPALADPDVRPVPILHAAAATLMAWELADRVEALRHVGPDLRDELRMQARLRRALRRLRLPESVLLENALAELLGQPREDLASLKARHRLALDHLSRQAMDQRVSRGRRALRADPAAWPTRRSPALFDILHAQLAGPTAGGGAPPRGQAAPEATPRDR